MSTTDDYGVMSQWYLREPRRLARGYDSYVDDFNGPLNLDSSTRYQ